MLSNINKYKIILASQSPRRQELLKGLNIPFEVKTIDVEETYPAWIFGVDIPTYLAEKKANAFSALRKHDVDYRRHHCMARRQSIWQTG